eukprot:560600-Alexandrium_andersonii.AAC.1
MTMPSLPFCLFGVDAGRCCHRQRRDGRARARTNATAGVLLLAGSGKIACARRRARCAAREPA